MCGDMTGKKIKSQNEYMYVGVGMVVYCEGRVRGSWYTASTKQFWKN